MQETKSHSFPDARPDRRFVVRCTTSRLLVDQDARRLRLLRRFHCPPSRPKCSADVELLRLSGRRKRARFLKCSAKLSTRTLSTTCRHRPSAVGELGNLSEHFDLVSEWLILQEIDSLQACGLPVYVAGRRVRYSSIVSLPWQPSPRGEYDWTRRDRYGRVPLDHVNCLPSKCWGPGPSSATRRSLLRGSRESDHHGSGGGRVRPGSWNNAPTTARQLRSQTQEVAGWKVARVAQGRRLHRRGHLPVIVYQLHLSDPARWRLYFAKGKAFSAVARARGEDLPFLDPDLQYRMQLLSSDQHLIGRVLRTRHFPWSRRGDVVLDLSFVADKELRGKVTETFMEHSFADWNQTSRLGPNSVFSHVQRFAVQPSRRSPCCCCQTTLRDVSPC